MPYDFNFSDNKNNSLLIKNLTIYGFNIKEQLNSVFIKNGKLTVLASSKDADAIQADYLIDAKGKYTLMPGMLDSHVHGQGGLDFADAGNHPQQISTITRALGNTGLSFAMATLVSLELSALKKSLAAIDQYIKEENINPTPGLTKIVGIHLEGPYISKKCKGAHAENVLQESINIDKFKDIINAAPSVKNWKITLAPDLIGALDFIRDVKTLEKEGIFVKIFLGHCNPEDKAIISKAIQAGAVGFTHLGNACQETCSRETHKLEVKDASSHLVQWVIENPSHCPAGVELIVDGVHLSKSFVSLIHSKVGNKIILVTDALGPSGLSDGLYKIGTLPILKHHNSFYLANEEGNFLMKDGVLNDGSKTQMRVLAGSAASLAQCARQFAEWTQPSRELVGEAISLIYAATVKNPRNASLSPDAISQLPDHHNFIIIDNQCQLVISLCNGKLQKHSEQLPMVNGQKQFSNISIFSQNKQRESVSSNNQEKRISNILLSKL